MPLAKLKKPAKAESERRSIVEVDKMIRRGQCLTKDGHSVTWKMAIRGARFEVATFAGGHD